MKNIPSFAILIVGIMLLIWGINASDSVGSNITEVVSGAPSDKSLWLLVLGLLGTISGAFGLIRGRSST